MILFIKSDRIGFLHWSANFFSLKSLWWIVAKLPWGQPIPPMGGLTISASSKEPIAVA